MNQMFFYHGHDLMHILEINQIVGSITFYPVLLVYLDRFLSSKALIGWLL